MTDQDVTIRDEWLDPVISLKMVKLSFTARFDGSSRMDV